jgi:two-component system, LytTR family, sensor kinase
MKTRKLIDFYLPFPWNIHARIVFLSLVGSIIFGVIGHGNIIQSLIAGGSIMILDAEIIYWISRSLFNTTKIGSPRDVTFQIIWRVVVFFLMIVVVGTIVASTVILLLNLRMGNELSVGLQNIIQFEIKGIMGSLILGALIATAAFFFMIWQEAMKSAFKAREQMLIYQSETLKNQINPHFLFNSLNTLSSLITSNPEKAETFTQKLSIIYRYILENREAETVPLNQEIGFVNDYFYLQKIRDEEKIELIIKIENKNCRILPVSLQLLVENAFKHNTATREKPLQVTIEQKGDWIEVRNNLQPKKQLGTSSGLGLQNLSERVRMQTGKELFIEKTERQFVVRMPIVSMERR